MNDSQSRPARAGFLRRAWRATRRALAGEQQSYTTGSLHRGIFFLAVPMMLEMAMESVFAVVDIYFLGQLHDATDAIAAVGLTESVLTLLYALAFGLSMAVTATVARRIGGGDEDAAATATWQAILLGLGISLVVAIPGVLFAPQVLALMDAPAEVVATGSGYARLLFGTNAVIMLIFLINAAFRGAGDSALAMRSLWLANGINIVLDPCLIHGWGPFPQMGVTGAALATTIGRGIGVLYQLTCLRRGRGRLHLQNRHLTADYGAMLRLLRVSGGGIAQMLIATASWLGMMRIVATFGKVPVSGYTVAIRILIFSYLPAFGLTNAAATLVGQNLGAGNPDRAERAVWLTGAYTMCYTAVVTVLFLATGHHLVALFIEAAPVRRVAEDALRIITYGYVFYGWGLVMMQAFNGAGDTMTPTRINLVSFWLLQLPLAWTLSVPAGLGPHGSFWSVMIAEAVLTAISIAVFRRGRWKQRQV